MAANQLMNPVLLFSEVNALVEGVSVMFLVLLVRDEILKPGYLWHPEG
jgi:hypothetical protein